MRPSRRNRLGAYDAFSAQCNARDAWLPTAVKSAFRHFSGLYDLSPSWQSLDPCRLQCFRHVRPSRRKRLGAIFAFYPRGIHHGMRYLSPEAVGGCRWAVVVSFDGTFQCCGTVYGGRGMMSYVASASSLFPWPSVAFVGSHPDSVSSRSALVCTHAYVCMPRNCAVVT